MAPLRLRPVVGCGSANNHSRNSASWWPCGAISCRPNTHKHGRLRVTSTYAYTQLLQQLRNSDSTPEMQLAALHQICYQVGVQKPGRNLSNFLQADGLKQLAQTALGDFPADGNLTKSVAYTDRCIPCEGMDYSQHPRYRFPREIKYQSLRRASVACLGELCNIPAVAVQLYHTTQFYEHLPETLNGLVGHYKHGANYDSFYGCRTPDADHGQFIYERLVSIVVSSIRPAMLCGTGTFQNLLLQKCLSPIIGNFDIMAYNREMLPLPAECVSQALPPSLLGMDYNLHSLDDPLMETMVRLCCAVAELQSPQLGWVPLRGLLERCENSALQRRLSPSLRARIRPVLKKLGEALRRPDLAQRMHLGSYEQAHQEQQYRLRQLEQQYSRRTPDSVGADEEDEGGVGYLREEEVDGGFESIRDLLLPENQELLGMLNDAELEVLLHGSPETKHAVMEGVRYSRLKQELELQAGMGQSFAAQRARQMLQQQKMLSAQQSSSSAGGWQQQQQHDTHETRGLLGAQRSGSSGGCYGWQSSEESDTDDALDGPYSAEALSYEDELQQLPSWSRPMQPHYMAGRAMVGSAMQTAAT